jgi:hypothetical protein
MIRNHWMSALILNFCLWSLGCASDPQPPRGSARAHPAAYSQDHFTYNKDQKPREDNDFDFYYKHCSVDERKPFPVGAIWQCTFP